MKRKWKSGLHVVLTKLDIGANLHADIGKRRLLSDWADPNVGLNFYKPRVNSKIIFVTPSSCGSNKLAHVKV